MKTMYKVYTQNGDIVGMFCNEAERDRAVNKYNGSYKTVTLRSANELYKGLKGYDILMTAKELGKMMDYIGGGGSMFPAEELENAVDDFLNEHGSKDDMTAYRDMESRLFAIAETERQNAFALGFETAVSLILSRELT